MTRLSLGEGASLDQRLSECLILGHAFEPAVQIHEMRDVLCDGLHHGAARRLAVGSAAHSVRHEQDMSPRLTDQGGNILGRQARLVHAQQLVQARNEELILILRSDAAAVSQATHVDIGRRGARFCVSDGRHQRGRRLLRGGHRGKDAVDWRRGPLCPGLRSFPRVRASITALAWFSLVTLVGCERPSPPGGGAPRAGHVFIVTEENQDYAAVIGSPSMPYLNSLAQQHGLANQYYANTHPSIGNYFMLATGQIITNDDSYS